MDKASLLKGLIIAVLIYYLIKGILFLLLYHVLAKVEERGLERAAKNRKAIEEMRRRRSW
ncbi:MAG: hypothetical protein U9N81_09135 [Bacillota bacterium]|nr:hypothetical protein [Bacillota bacterium]